MVATATEAITGDIVRRSASETDAVLARLNDRAARPGGTPAAVTPTPTTAATLAPVFFPGTAVMASATRIKLAPGEVRDGLDFVMTSVPVTTIEGTVVSLEGPLPASIQMSISPASTLRFFALSSANPQLVQAPGADGRFKYSTIVPGHYAITVRANRTAPPEARPGRGGAGAGGVATVGEGVGRGSPANTSETMYAVEEFDVVGQPVTGVTLRLQRGSRFAGRVAVDASSLTQPTDLTAIRVALQAAGSSGSSTVSGTIIGSTFTQSQPVAVRADGTFEIVGLAPGRYQVQVTVPAPAGQSWWFRSAMVGRRDVLDSTLDIMLGTDVTDAVLTLTDRRTELAGTLQSAAGLPAPEYFVIVLPADPALRTTGSGVGLRRVKSTRPATDGKFSFTDLPAGDYLLVALADVEPNEWEKSEFLQEIASSGLKVTIGEGEKKIQDLRISSRSPRRP